jgi:hypothetical protein
VRNETLAVNLRVLENSVLRSTYESGDWKEIEAGKAA